MVTQNTLRTKNRSFLKIKLKFAIAVVLNKCRKQNHQLINPLYCTARLFLIYHLILVPWYFFNLLSVSLRRHFSVDLLLLQHVHKLPALQKALFYKGEVENYTFKHYSLRNWWNLARHEKMHGKFRYFDTI